MLHGSQARAAGAPAQNFAGSDIDEEQPSGDLLGAAATVARAQPKSLAKKPMDPPAWTMEPSAAALLQKCVDKAIQKNILALRLQDPGFEEDMRALTIDLDALIAQSGSVWQEGEALNFADVVGAVADVCRCVGGGADHKGPLPSAVRAARQVIYKAISNGFLSALAFAHHPGGKQAFEISRVVAEAGIQDAAADEEFEGLADCIEDTLAQAYDDGVNAFISAGVDGNEFDLTNYAPHMQLVSATTVGLLSVVRQWSKMRVEERRDEVTSVVGGVMMILSVALWLAGRQMTKAFGDLGKGRTTTTTFAGAVAVEVGAPEPVAITAESENAGAAPSLSGEEGVAEIASTALGSNGEAELDNPIDIEKIAGAVRDLEGPLIEFMDMVVRYTEQAQALCHEFKGKIGDMAAESLDESGIDSSGILEMATANQEIFRLVFRYIASTASLARRSPLSVEQVSAAKVAEQTHLQSLASFCKEHERLRSGFSCELRLPVGLEGLRDMVPLGNIFAKFKNEYGDAIFGTHAEPAASTLVQAILKVTVKINAEEPVVVKKSASDDLLKGFAMLVQEPRVQSLTMHLRDILANDPSAPATTAMPHQVLLDHFKGFLEAVRLTQMAMPAEALRQVNFVDSQALGVVLQLGPWGARNTNASLDPPTHIASLVVPCFDRLAGVVVHCRLVGMLAPGQESSQNGATPNDVRKGVGWSLSTGSRWPLVRTSLDAGPKTQE